MGVGHWCQGPGDGSKLTGLEVHTQNVCLVVITTTPGDSHQQAGLGNTDPVLYPQFMEEKTEAHRGN